MQAKLGNSYVTDYYVSRPWLVGRLPSSMVDRMLRAIGMIGSPPKDWEALEKGHELAAVRMYRTDKICISDGEWRLLTKPLQVKYKAYNVRAGRGDGAFNDAFYKEQIDQLVLTKDYLFFYVLDEEWDMMSLYAKYIVSNYNLYVIARRKDMIAQRKVDYDARKK